MKAAPLTNCIHVYVRLNRCLFTYIYESTYIVIILRLIYMYYTHTLVVHTVAMYLYVQRCLATALTVSINSTM